MVQLAWVLRNFLSWIPCGLLDYFCWINLRGLIFWGSGVGGRPLHFVGLIFEWWREPAMLCYKLIWQYVTCNWRGKFFVQIQSFLFQKLIWQYVTCHGFYSSPCPDVNNLQNNFNTFFVFVAPLILKDCEWLGIQPEKFNCFFEECWFCACFRVPTIFPLSINLNLNTSELICLFLF